MSHTVHKCDGSQKPQFCTYFQLIIMISTELGAVYIALH